MGVELINKKRREFLGASAQVLSAVAVAGSAIAAPHDTKTVKEPAVIGYPNKKGVTIERVTYPARNMGTTIVANLFKPTGFDASRKYAAIATVAGEDWLEVVGVPQSDRVSIFRSRNRRYRKGSWASAARGYFFQSQLLKAF
jgi:hypothetical protein